ncbi:phosphoribosyltransferase family protein [Nocardia sp. NPDC049190]|uniref:orotate phosphoribosyltransferase n=1 Tax=Nocardia sp. NPDC049190 TaxID=3155650 RepID=UPI0033F29972
MLPFDLAERIRAAAIQRGKFILSCGDTLDEYFDEYGLAADPILLNDVAHALARNLPRRTDSVVAMALGGVPFAVAVSAISGLHTNFFRPSPKSYGTRRQIEGRSVDGSRVVLVDDVVRSGAQALRAAELLQDAGATVVAALCVLDRELGGRERLAQCGIELHALLTPATLYALGSERTAS